MVKVTNLDGSPILNPEVTITTTEGEEVKRLRTALSEANAIIEAAKKYVPRKCDFWKLVAMSKEP